MKEKRCVSVSEGVCVYERAHTGVDKGGGVAGVRRGGEKRECAESEERKSNTPAPSPPWPGCLPTSYWWPKIPVGGCIGLRWRH